MTFSTPVFLVLGVGLAGVVVVALWSHARRRRQLADFLGGRGAVSRISGSDLYRLRIERMVLLGAGALAIAAAAAEPRWAPPTIEPRPLPSRSVVLAIDISASMQASDVAPTRLAQAVRIASDLLGTMESDRVGLLLFAGTGYPLAPPTRDHKALAYLLRGLTPTMASVYDPGTLVSAGIREAVALLPARSEPGIKRAVIMITDGEVGEREPSAAAAVRAAAVAGIEVHMIGVGTARGAGMTLPDGNYRKGGTVVDATGAPVTSRLREALLRRLAQAGGGAYSHAGDKAGLRDLQRLLSNPVESPGPDGTPPPAWSKLDLTFWLALAALVLLLVESLLDVRLPRARFAARQTA